MEVHPGMSFYNDVPDGTALVTKTLESTHHLTPLHIPPGPPMPPDRYEELRDTFQLCKPVLKAGQEYGGSEPMLPESHRNYEPPYKFDHKHDYYGSARDAPVRLPNLPDNSVEYLSCPKYRSPGTQSTLLVESHYRPFHPYVHTSCNMNVKGDPYGHEGASELLDINKVAERNNPAYDPGAGALKSTCKPTELNISSRAVNMLANVKKSLWLSTYKRDYTGTGSMNPLLLDDFDAKVIGRATGELGKDVELRETFPSETSQVRPLEGRIARFLQRRPPYVAVAQQQDSSDVHEQHTNNSPIYRGYSEGVLSCQETSPRPLHQPPDAENGAKKMQEYLLQNENQPQADYQGESSQDKNFPMNRFRKITDTWKMDHLYHRQLAVPPDPEPTLKPTTSIYYEDLKPSRLKNYIVWHNPVSLNKPATKHLCFEKLADQQDLQYASSLQDILTDSTFPKWIPNCGVARPQTKLLDIQNSFTKTDTIKRLNDLTKEGIRDLRDHDKQGRRHKFQGVSAYFFH